MIKTRDICKEYKTYHGNVVALKESILWIFCCHTAARLCFNGSSPHINQDV